MRPFLFFLFFTALFAEEVTVDLRNPTYKNGILYTNQGGVIKNPDIRIQARTIQYIQRREAGKEIHKIEAEGDLLIQYKGRVYVGSELEYDFLKKTGVVYDGKTFSSLWFIGGDQIDLNPDGSYKVQNAFITTCENKDSSWDFHAGRVNVFKNDMLEAKKIRFRFFKIPWLWLPSLKLNLRKFKEPFFRWKFNWDKGPLVGFRYQLYSWQDFALFARAEYRWPDLAGGALETEYFPKAMRTTFVTRSYVGKDLLQNAPNAMFRFRLQGALHSTSSSGKTQTILTWDKYNDVRMPGDFKTANDFEINTAGQTRFYVHHTEPAILTYLKVRPRVNSFESIKQDLPTFYTSLLPRRLGRSGILSSFSAKLSYLDFTYSDQLVTSLQNFHSSRIELFEKLYRPIPLGPLTFTPHIGGTAIFYSNSPSSHSKNLALFRYGADLTARAQRTFCRYKHIIEPYANFFSLTHPTVSPDDHFIFSIQDGYNHINQFQVGVRNLLFSKKRVGKEASFTADLFANAFTSDPTIPQFIPRLYLNLDWRLPSVDLSFHNAWNFRNHVLDYSNARFLWTLNENVAIALEGRYRSRYDWRKADHENFILDVTRFQSELLLSPLSDRRITFLTHLFIRFTPFWECHFQSHHGFYRTDEKPYNEFKLDLLTWVSSACKIRFTLTRVAKYNKIRPAVGISFYK